MRSARARPLDRLVHRRRLRPLGVHRPGLGRPVRVVPRRAAAQGRGRPDRPGQRAPGGGGAASKVLELDVETALAGTDARPLGGDAARPAARGRRRPRAARASAPGTSSSRARGAASPASSGCCPSWPSSASTSSTCRRSTRSGARTARARQRARRRRRRPGQPVGDRLRGRAGTRRSTRSSGRSRSSTGSSPRARELGAGDRARLRDPVLARPPVAARAPGVVPPPPRRDAQVRREPAEALPGHLQRQLREPGLAGAVGGAARRRPLLGRPRRDACSGSTTRTRSRCRSGSG